MQILGITRSYPTTIPARSKPLQREHSKARSSAVMKEQKSYGSAISTITTIPVRARRTVLRRLHGRTGLPRPPRFPPSVSQSALN